MAAPGATGSQPASAGQATARGKVQSSKTLKVQESRTEYRVHRSNYSSAGQSTEYRVQLYPPVLQCPPTPPSSPGIAKMGPASDPESVVNHELKVRGGKGFGDEEYCPKKVRKDDS